MAISIGWKENFGISYKITFGTRERATPTPPASIVAPQFANADDVMIPSNAISKDNLEDRRGFTFNFESKQVASSEGSESEDTYLSLFNLNEEEKRILLQSECVVTIEAGFEGVVTLCYTGDVVEVTPLKRVPDTEYRIRLAAGSNSIRDQMVNSHYDETISDQDIIKDMGGRFSGLALGTYGLESANGQYKTGGRGFTGSLITNFDKMMAKYNLEYSVINGKIVIIPFRWIGEDWDKFQRTNYILNSDSIKRITEMSEKRGVSSSDTQSKVKKLQVNTFFIPVEIGQFITIPNDEYNKKYAGTYIVKGRRLILQSKGNAWDVVLEVEEIPV